MEYEELESVERLEELVGKIKEAQQASTERQAAIEDLKGIIGKLSLNQSLGITENSKLEKIFGAGRLPSSRDEIQAKIESLAAQEEEFSKMTETAAIEAKARLDAIRESSEKKFQEDLLRNAEKSRNSKNKAMEAIRSDEELPADVKEKMEKLKASKDRKAEADAAKAVVAKAKEEAKKTVKAKIEAENPGIDPMDLAKKIELAYLEIDGERGEFVTEYNKAEYRKMELEEYARLRKEEFDKIEAIAAKAMENLKSGAVAERHVNERNEMISAQNDFRAKMGEMADYLKGEFPEVMAGKFDKKPMTAMEKYEKQSAQYKDLLKREGEINAELDKVIAELDKDIHNKELQDKKAALEIELAKIAKVKPAIEKDLEEAKKLLGIKDEKDEKDEKGEGKGEEGDGKGEGKGEEGEGKGKKVFKLKAEVYYDKLNPIFHPIKRYITNSQIVGALYGHKNSKGNYSAPKLHKILILIPGMTYLIMGGKKNVIKYLEDGTVPALYLKEDQKLLGPGEEPEKEEVTPKPAEKEEKKNPFALNKEDKEKVERDEADRRLQAAIEAKMEEMVQKEINKLSPEERAALTPEKREEIAQKVTAKVRSVIDTSVKADAKKEPEKKETKTAPEKGEVR